MPKLPRVLQRAMAAVLLPAALASCTTLRVLGAQDPGLDRRATPSHPRAVVSYTTTDGREHQFVGFVHVAGDSLVFVRPGTPSNSLVADTEARTITLARDQVRSVRMGTGVSTGRSVVLGVIALAVISAFWLASVLSNMN